MFRIGRRKDLRGFATLDALAQQAGVAVPWYFVQPDGGPATDRTVVRLDLPQAVAPGGSTTLDLTASTGMRVTVSCNSTLYNEGESAPGVPQTVRVYTIDAVACNTTTSCPDASRATGPAYVERRLQIQASS